MVIAELKVAKKDKNRVHIYTEDGYLATIYIDILVENKLKIGSEITKEQINTLTNKSNNQKLLNLCINYIAKRVRSEREIREYMIKKIKKYEWDQRLINVEEIINKLYEYKYLDDQKFAEIWVSARINKGLGPQRLRMELIQKGIDKNIIDNILSNIDEETRVKQIEKLTQKYLKNRKFKNDYEKNWKLKQYLMSRGF